MSHAGRRRRQSDSGRLRSLPGKSAYRIATVVVRLAGFDCSGLVQYAYQRAGKAMPRTTAQLWAGTYPVNRDDIQVGDLLFFRIDGKMSHVGMYLGDNRFVHAPSTGKVVSIANLSSDYYRKAFIRARRPK